MPDDLSATLQKLRDLRDSGLLDDDEYAEKLGRLRTRYGDAAVDALLGTASLPPQSGGPHLVFNGDHQIGVVVGRDHYGHIFIGGQRTESTAKLLGDYLRRVAEDCDSLPLQPFRDKRDLGDTAAISLEQVYTELATRGELVERERFAGDRLRRLDVPGFFARHVGDRVLPRVQRTGLSRPLTKDEQRSRLAALRAKGAAGPGRADSDDAALLADESLVVMPLRPGREADVAALREQVPWLAVHGPQLVTEVIAAHPRLVLLGEPGSGKSTALRYLALTLARAATNPQINLGERLEGWGALGKGGQLLPIIVPLLPLAHELKRNTSGGAGAKELWNYVVSQRADPVTAPGLAEVLHSELEAGRVLLLLDGLDEVPVNEERRLITQAILGFARAYRTCRIVVSCRVRAYEGSDNTDWQLPGWATATLADWTPAQMRSFVEVWYGVIGKLPDDERRRRRTELQSALERRDDLRRLGVNPMLLTIMALVHFNDSRLPEERAALYSRCVDILLARWELSRVESGYASAYGSLMDYIKMPEADVKSLRPLLQRAAYDAQLASRPDAPGCLSRDQLRMLVADALEQRRHPDPHQGAKLFLAYTDQRAGLIQARNAGDEYVFPHQTFQEYLAGLQLVSGPSFVDEIMALRHEDRWRVPIMLGVGHAVSENITAVPFQLLHRLRAQAGRDEPRQQRDLILAAEIAEDVGWERLARSGDEFAQLRAGLAQDLVAVVEGQALPVAERVRAAQLLGMLGDPRPGVSALPPAMLRFEGQPLAQGDTKAESTQTKPANVVSGHIQRVSKQTKPKLNTRRSNVETGVVVISADDITTLPEFVIQSRDPSNLDTSDLIIPSHNSEFTAPTTVISSSPVPIAPFELARYPLTNAQYQFFIVDNGYDPAAPWWSVAGRAWLLRDDATAPGLSPSQRRQRKNQPEYWDDPNFGSARPNHPVVGISWYEATAFCAWLTRHLNDGYIYRLPSEVEWEYAARGAVDRIYPWGKEQPDGERANCDRIYEGTTAVGCFLAGATPEGLFDMAGNVWEWTSNLHTGGSASPSPAASPDNVAERLFPLCGGSWHTQANHLRVVNHSYHRPDYYAGIFGMRLARHRPT